MPTLHHLPRNAPFILLDDARADGAAAARLYANPQEVVCARRPDELAAALGRLEALRESGLHLAGMIAYEAGLVLEPKLAALADARCGANGPLLWFGAFADYQSIAPEHIPAWLAGQSDNSPSRIGPLHAQVSPGGYSHTVQPLQRAITTGDIYQVNYTFPLAGTWAGDPITLYAAIRGGAGAGHGGLLFDGTHWLLSFSPELFFAQHGDAITTRPMKGTRPRGATAESDAGLVKELASSTKDRAENLMIVDLLRNDLARVAVPGSVRVDHPFAIETYPAVHQMVSTVRAKLSHDQSLSAIIRALFPCGSITGAPKIRAMELIADYERDARGAYCGAMGRIDPPIDPAKADCSGEAAFNVAIRTLRLSPNESGDGSGGRAIMGIGSAIVADSEALAEWRECLVKGGFVSLPSNAALSGIDLIETMAFTPDAGIALLDLHLARAKNSAAELGFSFDRHAIRNAIQALCFEADAAARLRLVLSASGAYSLEIGAMPPPLPHPASCAVLRLGLDAGDWRLRHKQSDRWLYEHALAAAQGVGAVEALLLRDDGLITEGSFTSVFVERDGRLLTPPLALGLIPGVLRQSLIEAGKAEEAELTLDDLADGFFIGNAVRGLMPAVLKILPSPSGEGLGEGAAK